MAAAAIVIARSSFTVELDPVAPWLERRIAATVDPLRVRRGDLRLRWGGLVTPVVVRAERWGLLRADGEPLLDLPSVEIALDARAILRGEVQPLWAAVSNPRLSLDRDAQGAFVPSADDLAALSKKESSSSSSMLDAWRSPPASGPLARLEWVRIEDGAVAVRDRALALDWGIKGLAAELSRRHVETIDLTGSFEAANAETRAEVSFGGAFELERRRLGLELELADAELGQIARLHSTLASLAHLDLSLAARARVTLDAGELVADPIEIRLTGERTRRRLPRWCAATRAGRQRPRLSRPRPRPKGSTSRCSPRSPPRSPSAWPPRRQCPRSTRTSTSRRARSVAGCTRRCAPRPTRLPSRL